MLRHKSLFLILFISKLYSYDVVITNKDINYNEVININMISQTKVNEIKKYCKPLSYEDFKNNKYQASHYMRKGFVICEDDVKNYKKKSVLFDFGIIQIEKEGEVIYENDEYIRIKRKDGEIEKIYKDGRLR
ncbi:hypothetical protein CP965_11955 [Halarcobacter mediterraneus]|uniref:Uncharacterized protein n=1 Tax=Halarcobacter mediterraneus TaxID=2023153 RepID=A0A4Q1AWM5_9BACT|nr:hypothetical protein [Halarcobacter mediterraneus]RXK11888.1 hypothetical protein CP965_11955 [Halarcobacter mediterraneus]